MFKIQLLLFYSCSTDSFTCVFFCFAFNGIPYNIYSLQVIVQHGMGQENGGHQSARVGVLFVGIFARLVAGLSSSNLKLRRSDYVSPMHSTPKLRECYYLMQHNMSAYEGEACHHNPLSIFLVHTFGKALNHPVYGDFSFLVLFILLDVLSGYLLFSFGNHIVGTVKRGERREDATDGGGFIFHNELSKLSAGFKAILPTVMFAVALLHPYAILSCGALSTGGVSRFLLVCALNSVGVKNHLLAVLFGALAAFQDLSVLTVLLPLFICLAKEKVADDDGVRRGRGGGGGRWYKSIGARWYRRYSRRAVYFSCSPTCFRCCCGRGKTIGCTRPLSCGA